MSDILGWISGLIAVVVPGFGEGGVAQYHGYMEANYVYAAPASAGRIAQILVLEGAQVGPGDILFVLEDEKQQASLRAAEARVSIAEANWRNMETGSRKQEVAVIRAALAKAEADLALAQTTLARNETLSADGLVSRSKLDEARSKSASATAQVAQLEAQLEVAELPARDAQLVAAQASLTAARAERALAISNLSDRKVIAPVGGLVERVYFRAGEVAATGTPVVALLPPTELKARFFIPEKDRAKFALGDTLALSCDGCVQDIVATLSYMASDPQHTPPIIYSRDERVRLVFMAEARLAGEIQLLPGQPVTLTQNLAE